MLDMFRTLMTPRYPRHYIGRHRARRAVVLIDPIAPGIASLAVWEDTAT